MNCIIQSANLDDHVFEVLADYVNIIGLTVKGGKSGVFLSSNNNFIACNTINNNNGGINLFKSNNSVIKNNTVHDNEDFGIHLAHSCSNIIAGNVVINDGYCDIYLIIIILVTLLLII